MKSDLRAATMGDRLIHILGSGEIVSHAPYAPRKGPAGPGSEASGYTLSHRRDGGT